MNIAEILKDCSKGTKLYSPIFGDVYLDKIRPHLAIVIITDKEQGDFKEEFLYDGRYKMNGECMLFPSKENRDWSKFQRPFKDGDIIVGHNDACFYIAIYKKYRDGISFYHHVNLIDSHKLKIDNYADSLNLRFATEEEKQILFDAIKANGYKWNEETKTLEKLIVPKFKVGDRIRHKTTKLCCILGEYSEDISAYRTNMGVSITHKDLDNWELAPNKFDITTLKPFDKVLVRDHNYRDWTCNIFSHLNNGTYSFSCINTCYTCCIPYNDDTKHLLGTADDCDEYYKTW